MLLFWDIDGTLLTTGRAGIYAWEEALGEITGAAVDLQAFDTRGIPDFGIAERLLRELANDPTPSEALIRRLVSRYEALLPSALHRRQGSVLPRVEEILTALSGDPDTHSMLLTGNTRRGADAKLRHYGLAGFFDGGAFSDGGLDRDAIARLAIEQARARGRGGRLSHTFVIGDTPHDVRCGRSIGARTIALATGGYDVAALSASGPWKVLRELPPAEEFFALLAGAEVSTDA